MNVPLDSEPLTLAAPSAVALGPALRSLSDILGCAEDPSLRLVGVSVDHGVVRIRSRGADGIHVQHYRGEEAAQVVTELIQWSKDRSGSFQ